MSTAGLRGCQEREDAKKRMPGCQQRQEWEDAKNVRMPGIGGRQEREDTRTR